MATNSKAVTFTRDDTSPSYCDVKAQDVNGYTHTLRLRVTLKSIDENALTAKILAENILISQGISWSGDRIYFKIFVDDVEKASTLSGSSGGGTTTKTYATWEGDIPYDPTTGTLTAVIKATTSDYNGSYAPKDSSATITATFPTIDIASDFTFSSGSQLGGNVVINIAKQEGSTLKHKVEYSFAGSSYNVGVEEADTQATFAVPVSLATNIPNTTSGLLTVRVTTLTSEGAQVGSPVSKSITLTLPSNVVPTAPTLSFTHNSNNSTVKNWGGYVQGYSTVTATASGSQGAHGSTITSYVVSYSGGSGASPLTTGILNTAGPVQFTATVTDSRGRTNTKTGSITVAEYFKPSIELTAFRSNASGTADSNGTYVTAIPTFSYAPVTINNSDKNTYTRSVSCNGASHTSFSSGQKITLTANAAITSNYTVTATITDALGNSSTNSVPIPNTAGLPLHIKGNKKGIGLGTTATTDSTIEVGWPIDLNGNKIEGLVDLVYPVGAIYMSVNSTSPATLFGGTWSQLGGQFLLAASSTYAAGSTGGAATVSLATANLPSHTHSVSITSTSNGAHTHTTSGTAAEAGTHSHVQNTITWYNVKGDGYFPTSGTYYASSDKTYSTQDAGAHTHTVSGTAASNGAHTHTASGTSGSQGSGTAHNNMPPYLAVYMWKRTA